MMYFKKYFISQIMINVKYDALCTSTMNRRYVDFKRYKQCDLLKLEILNEHVQTYMCV